MRGWEALRHVDVSTFGGYECFIGLFSPFPFVFQIRMRIRGRFNAFCADVTLETFVQPLSGFFFNFQQYFRRLRSISIDFYLRY